MRELGLSRGQFAEQIDLNQSTVWRYRKGRLTPTLRVLRRMRDVLGLSIDELTADTPAEHDTEPDQGTPWPSDG
jgi:transcriptional regulator with XRE-family HTH domain